MYKTHTQTHMQTQEKQYVFQIKTTEIFGYKYTNIEKKTCFPNEKL